MPDLRQLDTAKAVVSIKTPTPSPATPEPDKPSSWRARLQAYGYAVTSVALMTLLRIALAPLLHKRAPFITYFLAVIYSAYKGGIGPGILSILLGSLIAWYYIIPSAKEVVLTQPTDAPAIVVFVFGGLAMSLMGEAQRRAQQRAEAAKQEAQRTAEELRYSEQRLATTLHSIGDAVITTDKTGRVTFLNPVAEALTGWTQAEAAGRPLDEVFVIVQEETRQPAENPGTKVLQTGALQGLANHTLLIARDGTERPIDDSAAPIRTGDDLSGVVLVFRDITQRRQEERALQSSEERFRILAEAMPQFVWVSDTEGKVEYVNSRWTDYTGQTLAETGPHNDRIIHPEDAASMWERWSRARAAGTEYESEFRCRRLSDGAYRWFLARGVPVTDAQGQIVRWIGTSTDVHDLKEAEAQIGVLNTRLHRAVTESSHRIKNQLQILAAIADMALAEGATQIPAEALRRLGTQIRTLSILQDILTVEWKADTSGASETISCRAMLERVLDVLQQASENRTIACQLAEQTLPIRQATALALACNEVVTNAIKYGRRQITVTLTVEDEHGVLEACDDGPGFPAGFDPLLAANTGLELISSLVVHDLAGTVRYENRAEGGARVRFIFPIPRHTTSA